MVLVYLRLRMTLVVIRTSDNTKNHLRVNGRDSVIVGK